MTTDSRRIKQQYFINSTALVTYVRNSVQDETKVSLILTPELSSCNE
jgi:hypothetical protein